MHFSFYESSGLQLLLAYGEGSLSAIGEVEGRVPLLSPCQDKPTVLTSKCCNVSVTPQQFTQLPQLSREWIQGGSMYLRCQCFPS